jgi:hypothetical protein
MLVRRRAWYTQPRQAARARLGLDADRQFAVQRAERAANQGRTVGSPLQDQREMADAWQPVHSAAILQAQQDSVGT